ncbi:MULTISPECIES: hypothetical protein [unclassified Bradyrhizobium]|uniref:hypothetical protein n=1 Tax=unclassified Bradyrhizobium TaxID=2631580 RepID=UPI002916F184|nr:MULTISPECIES: hypothetical protein [unclassified Bradyrhizobium]
MWQAIIGFLGGPVIRGLLDAYNAKLKAGNVDNKIASDLAAGEIAAQSVEIQEQTRYRVAALGYWYEPDKLMGYAVAIYFGKLLIWDKVLGLGGTDPLGMKNDPTGGFAATTANIVVMFYFGKRGFENVANIFASVKRK